MHLSFEGDSWPRRVRAQHYVQGKGCSEGKGRELLGSKERQGVDGSTALGNRTGSELPKVGWNHIVETPSLQRSQHGVGD